MPIRIGQAFWPGVGGFISCSYTCSQGITPGIATLEIPEQDVSQIRPFGDLTITDGFGGITLRRCRIQSIDFIRDGGGRRIVLHIADRRWMWRYGYITGSWNIIDPFPDPNLLPDGEFTQAGGPYAPGTYRPAHLLMLDCLQAMGETSPFINPAPVVPIQAVWDYDNPASSLATLAEAVNFRVCFQVSTDRVLVAPQGTGSVLPDALPVISESPAVSLPTRPGVIQLVGGEVIFNDLLALEPVGMEPDGSVKPIDELSYKPDGGWSRTSDKSFAEVTPTTELTRDAAIEQAKKCIWRMFRVKMIDVTTGGPGPNVAGYGLVRDRKQIELLPNQYGTSKQANGQPDTSPPYVLGSVYGPRGVGGSFENDTGQLLGNTDPKNGTRLAVTPTIDGGRGLVVFDRQCFRNSGTVGAVAIHQAPELYLYTGFRLRDIIGRKPVKFVRGGANDTALIGCPAEVLRHPELVLTYRGIRGNTDRSLRATDDNLADILPAANYYLDQANAKYNVAGATSRTYAGIYPIDCDGAIQQVSWRVGGGAPATTTASLNTEHDAYVPTYPERRRNEKVIAFSSKLDETDGGGGDFGNRSRHTPPPFPPT